VAEARARESRAVAYIALIVVCVLWGTTYLAIRISIETIPPFYMMAFRYTISGSVLLVLCRFSGLKIPRGRELIQTSGCGVLCIGVGNGLLVVAETWVPSGLSALVYTTAAFWMVGLDTILPGGKKPPAVSLRGLLVGMAGVMILILPAAWKEHFQGATWSGFLLLQLSVAGWAAGALLQKRVRVEATPLVSGAVQQLAAGLAGLFPALAFERLPKTVSLRSELAFVYLIVFGAIIGFSCFIYAVAKLPVAIMSVYTFVNPVVAVILGWLVFHEPFGHRELIAMLVIFIGIAIVRIGERGAERGMGAAGESIGEMETVGPEP